MTKDIDLVICAAKRVCDVYVHSEQMELFYRTLCSLREEMEAVEAENCKKKECNHEWIMLFNRTLLGKGKETATRFCPLCHTREDAILNWGDIK